MSSQPVVIVGAGPVGLTLAIDLAQRGQSVIVLSKGSLVSSGSKAICFAKRSLEIFDRLGCGQRMVDKGVSWNVGKVFLKDHPLYTFNLQPEAGHERPAFINLQQYYVEAYLAERAAQLPNIEIRWHSKVTDIQQSDEEVALTIEMSHPIELNEKSENCYTLNSKYAIACDGSRSSIRQIMGLESTGRVFQDRFLIADVKMKAEFPTERWFWFDPPFHPNQSVLLHRQPDNVWRIDFQLGWDADPEVEKRPENIMPRVKALLAHGVKAGEAMPEFELEWASVYTFACQRMEKFVHDRVIFAGDSAHGVSPFGARGANSGIQDADNLGWKLDAVLRGLANKALLQTYGAEREFAADENIKNSTRATDFITPKSTISRIFRDAVLDLAAKHPFARTLVNSGRLSVPATLYTSELSTTDVDVFNASVVLGSPALDAPVRLPDGQVSWLLKTLSAGFTLIVFDAELDTKEASYPCTVIHVQSVWFDSNKKLDNTVIDSEGLIQKRYDMQAGTAYLLRPDQHVCARWRQPTQELVLKAIQRCYSPQVQI